MDKRTRGAGFEQQACDFLQAQGLRLVERNWSCRYGELDLIMRDGESWVFVEVRARASSRFGGAAASIDYRKQQKLQTAANLYLQQHRISAPCRFDSVLFEGDSQPCWLTNVIGQ